MSNVEEMLTKEEGYDFIKNALQIDSAEERFQNDRLGLLDDIIISLLAVVPGQCITLLQLPPEQRDLPTLADVRHAGLTKVGGLCYTGNVFMYYLLKAVSYDVAFNIATVYPYEADDHVIVLVRNVLKQDDLYLADCACFVPTFGAVCLDFDMESQWFHNIFNEYKFIKEGNVIRRLQRSYQDGTLNPTEEVTAFYQFVVDPTSNISEFDACMKQIYIDPKLSPFHLSYRAIRFTIDDYVIIVNSKLIIGSADGTVTKTTLDDDSEIMEATKKYFPELEESAIKAALENWRKVYNK